VQSKCGRAIEPGPLGLFALMLAAFGSCVVVSAIDASRGMNALEFPLPDHQAIFRQLAPQNWAFFTRDPQEEATFAFRRSPDGWVPAGLGANAEPRNAFGFDRAARAVGFETGLVMEAIRDEGYRECTEAIESCLERQPIHAEIDSITPNPHLCGELGLVKQKPVPWAWARSGKPVQMPARVVRVVVRC
jgi:antimicrobial peptide system SdpA family protein